MVTMAQSAANLSNTHTDVDRTHSITHTCVHQHSYNQFVRSASSAITEFGIGFLYLKVPDGGGANRSTRHIQKCPDFKIFKQKIVVVLHVKKGSGHLSVKVFAGVVSTHNGACSIPRTH